MLFNSIDFAVFLPIVFLVYWAVNGNLRLQNAFVILAGFVFYGWWDWRFLGLLIFTSGTDYLVALGLERSEEERHRKWLLAISLIANLGLLGFFKYYDFFIVSFQEAFTWLGLPFGGRTLGLVLPVGISFYTFQSLSYTIDVYRRQLQATRSPVTFFAFVSFFPQMLAGPIERARHMIPQFEQQRRFDPEQARDGVRQMLWGLFKKVVVADTCAAYVNAVFADQEHLAWSALLMGAVFFAFQIYGDFSGYSDIAIGCARLFGFELMRNFAYPYFSRDIAEFWRRWHISLSTWFRDYLYIPLGGSKGSRSMVVRNTMIIFLMSGFWHGANWTFVVWGALNALYFLPQLLSGSHRANLDIVANDRVFPTWREFLGMGFTFLLTCLAWVFFRATTLHGAFDYLGRILTFSAGEPMPFIDPSPLRFILVLVAVEWVQRRHAHGLRLGDRIPRPFRWCIYSAILLAVIYLGGKDTPFIYFQF
jgi:D-alanyl-lipoteichoic acid acyltransferase DltB (MBOAT superfamily)